MLSLAKNTNLSVSEITEICHIKNTLFCTMRMQYSIQVSLYVHQREQTLEVQKAEQSRQEAHDVIQDLRKQKMVFHLFFITLMGFYFKGGFYSY